MGKRNGTRIQTLLFGVGLALSLIGHAWYLYQRAPGFALAPAALVFLVLWNLWRKPKTKLDGETLPFDLLVKNSGDLIGISDTRGKIVYLNKAGLQISGLRPDVNLSTLNRTQFYTPETHARINTEVLPALIAHGSWSGEIEYRNQTTGESVPVFANFFRLLAPETGEPLGMAVIARDIRDRRQLERQFNRFFEVSLDMLAIGDHNGHFVKVNPAFTHILGYSEEELLSRPIIDFLHPDDVGPTLAEGERQRHGAKLESFENRYLTKSGEYRWFSWHAYSDLHAFYAAGRDITEAKRQRVAIEELGRQAIAASEAKSRFLANMSHEIRTPINGVVGMTGLLLNTSLDSKQFEFAESIRSSARQLLTIIGDILDFSKVESGQLALEAHEFDLHELARDAVRSLAWAGRERAVPVELTLDQGVERRVLGDAGRLQQILNHLLSNALKFTMAGRVHLDVRAVGVEGNSTRLRFAVTDTGIGLRTDGKQNLFSPFSQADNSPARRFGGAGLGLTLAKSLVELMGGEIGVESVEGQGSTFWFTVPLARALTHLERPEIFVGPTKHAKAEILVAEDNLLNQKIVLAMVENLGFRARAVANGREVLAQLEEHSFDLILMDCQMPELDGFETTRRIRAHSYKTKSTVPIIALTANALKGDRELCLAAGMDDYAAKPIEADQLARLIERWLDLAKVA